MNRGPHNFGSPRFHNSYVSFPSFGTQFPQCTTAPQRTAYYVGEPSSDTFATVPSPYAQSSMVGNNNLALAAPTVSKELYD